MHSRSPAASTSRSIAGTRASTWRAIRAARRRAELCGPVHDLQLAVSGAAAEAVSELARLRWAAAEGETLPPCDVGPPAWPVSAPVWLTDVSVGIARTRPKLNGQGAVDEIAKLNDAALASARSRVYIEAQYLCAEQVGDRLERLLRRAQPPEVVMVVWQECHGWLERLAMAGNRDRLLRRLAAADHAGRLRVYRLVAHGDPECEIKLHAKLVIVDDRFVRVGSSNLNNRSLGVDTECDLAIEARDAATCEAISRLTATLIGEHTGTSLAQAHRAVQEFGLSGAIERLNGGRLQAYEVDPQGETKPVAGTAVIDPQEPLDLDFLVRAIRAPLPGL